MLRITIYLFIIIPNSFLFGQDTTLVNNPTEHNNPFGPGSKTEPKTQCNFDNSLPISTTRNRLSDPILTHIKTERDITIQLKMTIDENGSIVTCASTSKTTTTDQKIINQVIQDVKTVKYNTKPGAGLESVFLTLQVLKSK